MVVQFTQVHALVRPAKQVFVGHRKVQAVKGDAQGLLAKSAVDVGVHALLFSGKGLLVFFVAHAVLKFHDEGAVSLGHLSVLGVDDKHAPSLGVAVVVNEHVVQRSVRMFGAHPNGESIDAVVEDPFTDVEGGLLFGDRVEEGSEPHVGGGPSCVAEPQGAAADDGHAQDEGAQDA